MAFGQFHSVIHALFAGPDVFFDQFRKRKACCRRGGEIQILRTEPLVKHMQVADFLKMIYLVRRR